MQFVLTLLFSGVVSALVSYRLTSSKEYVVFMRGKAEDLYLAMNNYRREIIKYNAPARAVLDGKFSPENFGTAVFGDEDDDFDYSVGRDRVMMLTQIYFPEIVDDLMQWNSDVAEAQLFFEQIREGAITKKITVSPDLLQHFDKLADQMQCSEMTFRASLVQQAHRYASSSSLWPKQLTVAHWRTPPVS